MAENPTTKPVTIDPSVAALMAAYGAGGAGGGASVAMPATQRYGLVKVDEAKNYVGADVGVTPPPGLAWVENPNYTAPKPATKTLVNVGSDELGHYLIDPDDPTNPKFVLPAHTPNADEEMGKAMKREQDEQLRIQRQNNEKAGLGYADDDTVAKRSLEARKAGLDDRTFAQSKANDDEKIRQYDITRAAQDKVDAANIGQTTANTGLIGANTARTGAETTQIQQNLGIAGRKEPYDLAQAAATTEGTIQSTAASKQSVEASKQAMAIAAAAKPVDTTFGTTSAKVAVTNPLTGRVTYEDNPNYQPKTLAEVQARVGQIQSIMQSKMAELQGKVGQNISGKLYTNDDALKDYNAWHAQNVQPQMGALEAARQDAVFARAKDEAAMRTQAYTAASTAGTQAINAAKEDKSGRVGPGFNDLMSKITAGKGLATGADFNSAFTFQAPLSADTAHNAVMEALKHISPTAAAATGTQMPNYGGVDIQQTLGSMPYWPQGQAGGAPPAPAPAAAPAAPGPGGGADDWFAEWQKRQAADAALQQRQAQVPMPVPQLAPAFKTGWPGSDPRLSGILDPTQYLPDYSLGG